MSKYLEYILKLKDQITEPLKKVAGASSGATGYFQKLKNKVDELNGSLSKVAGGSLLKSIIGGNLISGAITGVANNVGNTIASVIQAGMDAAKNKASFETLSGIGPGDKLFSDLTKFAQDSIFGNELYDNAKMMRSFGIETEKIMPNLKMLGDISMGNKEKLASLTLAFSQVSSAGRLQGQDLLQMINAGFNPLNIISQKTGKSLIDLRKQMEKGGISFQMVEDAFKSATGEGGMFYKMTEKIANTPFGKWEAFKGQLDGIRTKIGSAIMPAFGKLVDFLSTSITKIGNFFTGWWNKIREGSPFITAMTILLFSAVGAMILMQSWALAISVATKLAAAGQWLWNAAMSANPIGLIITAIIAFGAIIGYIIYRYSGWGEAWKNLVSFLSNSWNAFKETFHLIWLGVEDTFLSGIETMQRAWFQFKSLWDEDGANEGLAKLNKQSNDRARQLAESAGKIAEYNKLASESWNKVGLTDTGKTVADLASSIKSKLGISIPKLPGAGNAVTTSFSAANAGAGSASGGKSNDAVATGGTKNTTIHISIGKQIERLEVVANNIQEGAGKIRDIIVDEMARAIAMSQAIAE